MKERLRKSLIWICVIFFAVLTTLAHPMQKVEAGPLAGAAVPAGIQLGAGAYVTIALATAGIAGMIGYEEHGDAINAHAQRVWSNSTQLAKDSLAVSLEAAKGVGTALVPIGSDLANFYGSQLDTIASEIAGYGLPQIANANMYEINRGSYIRFEQHMHPFKIYSGGQETFNVMLSIDQYDSFLFIGTIVNGVRSSRTIDLPKFEGTSQAANDLRNATLAAMRNVTTPEAAKSFLNAYGAGVMLQEQSMQVYNNVRPKVQEAWESMRDAGLVLPVDSAVPYDSTGQPLNYNPQADSYAGIDGVPYTGQVDWRLPNIKWREQSDKVSIPGVYVDTPVLTGNPEYDQTRNPDVPNTTTNVFTGTTIANPDIATGNPSVPVEGTPPVIPDFAEPGSKTVDWKPFLRNGSLMKEKFPFSIPFDFLTQLEVLNVAPEAPTFKVNVQDYLKIGGYTIPFKMDLSFEMFDPIANIIRWGLIVIFDISLIFAIRKLMPE